MRGHFAPPWSRPNSAPPFSALTSRRIDLLIFACSMLYNGPSKNVMTENDIQSDLPIRMRFGPAEIKDIPRYPCTQFHVTKAPIFITVIMPIIYPVALYKKLSRVLCLAFPIRLAKIDLFNALIFNRLSLLLSSCCNLYNVKVLGESISF